MTRITAIKRTEYHLLHWLPGHLHPGANSDGGTLETPILVPQGEGGAGSRSLVPAQKVIWVFSNMAVEVNERRDLCFVAV